MVLASQLTDWLKTPPGWVVAIILALLVGHLLKRLLDIFDRTKDHTINAIEIIVTLGLVAAAFHQAYENSINRLDQVAWFDQPLVFLVALVFFGILSGILVIIHKRFST